jgi:hypothetical protein
VAEDSTDNTDLEKPAKDKAGLARKWRAEIAAAEKAHKKFVQRGQKIEKIYNDERDMNTERARLFNILWSNVETLRPAVYMQTPKAKAVRRYRDRDPVARLGAQMLERCVQTSCELYDFDHTMDQAVRDRLLPGRGQVWVSYVPTLVGSGEDAQLAYESVVADYVPWQDFLHSVAKTWTDVWWVAKRFHKSKSELPKWLEERGLEPKQAGLIAMDCAPDSDKTDDGLKDERAKAQLWEIHDKVAGVVHFLAPGSGEHAYLGKVPPPVRFRDFFPCPRPLLATTTAKSCIPTPDYALYQDQAEELNRITARIGVLQKALKVAGVYASESAELASLLESGDNRMIAVKDWAMFAEGGGVKGRIEWFPVEHVAEVLKSLYEIREQAKQTLYEVSGIGDILRGATDPDETATAQGIKAKWGSLRVRRVQKDVQRFAADIMRLKAEVIAEAFGFEEIMRMAGVDQELLAKYIPQLPPPPMPEGAPPDPMMQQQMQMQQQQATTRFLKQVEAMLRDDTSRSFRIDVETDSTLEPDQAEEKQTAVEFMTAATGFMEAAAPMAAQGPEAAKLVGEMLLFGVRRFDKVDQLEQTIEQAVEAASKPRPPQPDPEMIKTEAEIKRGDAKLKIEARKADTQIAAIERKTEAEIMSTVATTQADLAMKRETNEVNMDIAAKNAAAKRAMQEGGPPN